MKNKLFIRLLFVLALLVIMQTTSGQEGVKLAYPEVPRITCQELKKLMDEGVPLIIIDTNHKNLYDKGHIKGAVNIYSDPFMNPVDRANILSAIPADRQIVICCAWVDDKESAGTVLDLWDLHYEKDKIKALRGGINQWMKLGYPIEKAGS